MSRQTVKGDIKMKKILVFTLMLLCLSTAATAQWQDDVVLINELQMGEVYPDEGGNAFIILEQFDNNCGPTSVEMLLYYYTKWKSLTDVWSAGDIYSVEFGAWPWELRQALNELDVPTHWYDELTPSDLRYYIRNNRPPIILLRFENGLHYVVVVGYYQGSQNWYLVADPNGWFTWYTEERLETGWSLEHPGISDSVPNAFTLEGVGAWLAAEISDLSLDSNNAIVPQYAPTRHFYNLWAEMLAVKVYGDSIPFGTTHGWHSTLDFGKSINYIQVSDIELLSSTGTATLDDYNWTQGGSTVRLEGRIEDGAILRGRMWVIVRAFRVGAAFAAPVYALAANSHITYRNVSDAQLPESIQSRNMDTVSVSKACSGQGVYSLSRWKIGSHTGIRTLASGCISGQGSRGVLGWQERTR